MVAEELVLSLSGGAPWGFRLQGGAEHRRPLQVAKVRRRSKACRAGLKEQDELVSIGEQLCSELSHADAMSLLEQHSTIQLRVKRAAPGFYSLSSRLLSPTEDILQNSAPCLLPTGLTSPPDSEAYYGETDSDADTQSLMPRRQRRTPPHARSPARYDQEEEEMSGYESASDATMTQRQRELIFQPLQPEWECSTSLTPHTLTPHTLTPHTLSPCPDPGEADGEGDSGFQEVTGACVTPVCPLLMPPERVNQALALGFPERVDQDLSLEKQLVPMVGPQDRAVNDELSTTYKEKARQAKLQRGESQVEKQVKEARTKCRSIASLLTDAPNPNSKGVLMFKKRRQRAKKYTLTCFGKAPEDRGSETEGETEEEGGSSIQSGSELDEEGFSASYDPTWDSGYLDLLDRRSSACPSTTPATPTTDHNQTTPFELLNSSTQSPGLEAIPGLDYRDTNLENGIPTLPITSLPIYTPMSPPAMPTLNGEAVVEVSCASMVLSPPPQTPMSPSQQVNDPNSAFNPSPNNVLNRTARPFYSSPSTPSRPTVTSVMFRPPQPKPISAPAPSVSAMSTMSLPSPRQPDSKRAVSSTSLYIPARTSNGNSSDMSSSIHSPPSSLSSATTVSQSAVNPTVFSPLGPVIAAQPYNFPAPQQEAPLVSNYYNPPPQMMSPTTPSYGSNISPISPEACLVQAPMPPSPQVQVDSLASREQRISVPAARTGILHEARKRNQKKPMFSALQSKDVNPNPDLLSIIQNMDDPFGKSSNVETSSGAGAPVGEMGHESGPEEDWLRLGAEACNFMQAQRQPKPPPVAPKPKSQILPQTREAPPQTEMPILGGKGGQLFAKRQNRMDRYVVERCPSVAAVSQSPREPSPTPSLPAAWKYSSSIRAPPPINYNPLLSPSCPLKAQKKTTARVQESSKSGTAKSKKKLVDLENHQPYQLNSTLFSYNGNTSQANDVHKTAKVREVKRFSTPPPTATGPALKVIAPRSATTLGEPLWRSELASPPPPAPTGPLPLLPTFSSSSSPKFELPAQASRQAKSVPDLSPARSSSQSNPQFRVPRPRFSTSNLGLQPCVWRPGSTLY